MPELVFGSNVEDPAAPFSWSAIWAGTFTFVAIWAVFGLLGEAIFSSTLNTRGAGPGIGVGMAIWAVILTIIAMFIAGRTTGRASMLFGYTDALMRGVVMFGLSMVAVLALCTLGEAALGGLIRTAPTVDVLQLFGGLGWVGFASLFLGWLAAMGGACTTVHNHFVETPAGVRRAA